MFNPLKKGFLYKKVVYYKKYRFLTPTHIKSYYQLHLSQNFHFLCILKILHKAIPVVLIILMKLMHGKLKTIRHKALNPSEIMYTFLYIQ